MSGAHFSTLAVLCCLLFPTASLAQRQSADVAPAPALPENYREIAQDQIRPTLRDPQSARFEFRSEPYQMTCGRGVFQTPTPITIWMIDVWVNGTNAYGGFTGFQPMSVIIFARDNDLLAQPYRLPGGGAITQYRLCRRV